MCLVGLLVCCGRAVCACLLCDVWFVSWLVLVRCRRVRGVCRAGHMCIGWCVVGIMVVLGL